MRVIGEIILAIRIPPCLADATATMSHGGAQLAALSIGTLIKVSLINNSMFCPSVVSITGSIQLRLKIGKPLLRHAVKTVF